MIRLPRHCYAITLRRRLMTLRACHCLRQMPDGVGTRLPRYTRLTIAVDAFAAIFAAA